MSVFSSTSAKPFAGNFQRRIKPREKLLIQDQRKRLQFCVYAMRASADNE